jgi:hypothetical protein
MASETLFWLSGLSLTVGGGSATIGWLLFALVDRKHKRYEDRSWLILNGLIIGGGLFMALGLPGFYARQAEQSGLLGLIGFVVLFVGIVIPYIAVHSVETVTAPKSPAQMRLLVRVGAPAILVGVMVTGLATWRAGVYPTLPAFVLMGSVLLGLLSRVAPWPKWWERSLIPALLTGTMAWLGLALMVHSAG